MGRSKLGAASGGRATRRPPSLAEPHCAAAPTTHSPRGAVQRRAGWGRRPYVWGVCGGGGGRGRGSHAGGETEKGVASRGRPSMAGETFAANLDLSDTPRQGGLPCRCCNRARPRAAGQQRVELSASHQKKNGIALPLSDLVFGFGLPPSPPPPTPETQRDGMEGKRRNDIERKVKRMGGEKGGGGTKKKREGPRREQEKTATTASPPLSIVPPPSHTSPSTLTSASPAR